MATAGKVIITYTVSKKREVDDNGIYTKRNKKEGKSGI